MQLLKQWLFVPLLLVLGVPAQASPPIAHWRTPEGARVFFVETHALPVLDVQVDFPAGSAHDPEERAGLAELTRALLVMGVQGMDETTLSNRLADLGALLGGGADMDRATQTLRTLSTADKRTPALAIFKSILGRPTFPADVLAREKARTIASIKESLTRPDVLATKNFWDRMYPGHPYGRKATPESVHALQQTDLLDFYRRHYTAAQASITIVGDVARVQAEAIARELAAELPAATGARPLKTPSPPKAGVVRVAHPAAQAHLLMGLPAIRRGDPDFFPLLVGNYSLGGGGFVSRLMKEVREKRGLAYSVYSHFTPMAQPGPFQIGLQTQRAQAAEAIALVRGVLAEFLAGGPSDEELRAAKQNLSGSFPLNLDSNQKMLSAVALIGFYGLPLDYLDRYPENIEKVTATQVGEAFRRHIRLDEMVTVVVAGE